MAFPMEFFGVAFGVAQLEFGEALFVPKTLRGHPNWDHPMTLFWKVSQDNFLFWNYFEGNKILEIQDPGWCMFITQISELYNFWTSLHNRWYIVGVCSLKFPRIYWRPRPRSPQLHRSRCGYNGDLYILFLGFTQHNFHFNAKFKVDSF